MNLKKSFFTSILPMLCIAGAIILGLTWNQKPTKPDPNLFKINGPQTPPFKLR